MKLAIFGFVTYVAHLKIQMFNFLELKEHNLECKEKHATYCLSVWGSRIPLQITIFSILKWKNDIMPYLVIYALDFSF